MAEDDTEALLEVVPEELTDGKVLELEQGHTAEEEARERKLQEKKKNPPTPPRNFTVKG